MFVIFLFIYYVVGSYIIILCGGIVPSLYLLVRPLSVYVRCIIWRTERQFKLKLTTIHTEIMLGNNTYFWKTIHSLCGHGGKSLIFLMVRNLYYDG